MFDLGNSLREARVRQGLDFPQAELATKIRAKYLRALEEEQFDVLPAETYVKGFLHAYADFLGLEGQLYVDEYQSRFAADGFVDARAHRSSARQHDLSFERRAVVLALVGMAAKGLVFSGAGTYIEVRHGSASGKVLYEGTLQAGDLNAVPGQRFWIRILHPQHLRLTLNGKAVSLPARKSLRVVVTPSRTALASA